MPEPAGRGCQVLRAAGDTVHNNCPCHREAGDTQEHSRARHCTCQRGRETRWKTENGQDQISAKTIKVIPCTFPDEKCNFSPVCNNTIKRK